MSAAVALGGRAYDDEEKRSTGDTSSIQHEGLNSWVSSGASGMAARSIAAHLAGHGVQTGDYPHWGPDFSSCERLLDMVPSLRAEMHRMVEVNAYWAALIPRWADLLGSDHCTETIQEIVAPIEDRDPRLAKVGAISLRIGTFIDFSSEDLARAVAEGRYGPRTDEEAKTAIRNDILRRLKSANKAERIRLLLHIGADAARCEKALREIGADAAERESILKSIAEAEKRKPGQQTET